MSARLDDLAMPTIADIVADIGIVPRPDEDIVFAVIEPGEAPVHYTLRRLADRDPANASSLYVASGAFRQGSVSQWEGRRQENVSRVFWLPFDADLADWLQFPDGRTKEDKAERERGFAWLRAMSDDELAPFLAAQREDIEEVFDRIGLPIHRLDYTGYGHCAYVYLNPEDQHRVEDAKAAHQHLIRLINETARPIRLVDPQVSDPGTRITRLPGSVNRKGPIPRTVRTLAFPGGSMPLGQRAKTVRPAATFVSRDGEGLAKDAVDALVSALEPSWTLGQKHAMGLAVGGILAKAGIPETQATAIVERLASADENPRDRIKAVSRSYDRVRSGLDVRGFYSLRSLVPADTLTTVDGILKTFRRPAPPKEAATLTAIGQQHPPVPSEIVPRFTPAPETAFRGWFGAYRDLMAPTTEAPDAFHLGSSLVLAGMILGRRAWTYQGNRLFGNLYVVLVGPTGQARKDTAMNRALGCAVPPDDPQSGKPLPSPFYTMFDVTSSEGIIASLAMTPTTLIYMTELSMLLLRARRQSTSTLLTTLIKLWDSPERIDLPTRNEPIVAHDPFLSILTATTPDTLAEDIQPSDLASGFANRFLFFGGEGVGPKANPPRVDKGKRDLLMNGLRDAMKRYVAHDLELTGDAVAHWSDWYNAYYRWDLHNDEERQMVQRLGANIHKIALLYAATDGATAIGLDHLTAAIAVVEWSWGYVRRELHHWGQEQDAKIADKIEAVLRRKGPTHKRQLQMALGQRLGPGTFIRVLEAMVKGGRLDLDAVTGSVALGTGGDTDV